MVCQAASKTRFRVLKYENGIAGKPSIIVRLIACYQPLQDCQKQQSPPHCGLNFEAPILVILCWMVKAENSWRSPPHPAWQSPNFNCMSTSPDPAQLGCLPERFSHPGIHTISASTAMPGFAVPIISSVRTQPIHVSLPQSLSAHFRTLFPPVNPHLKENISKFSFGLGGEPTPNPIPGCQRRFVVFDQSGNGTRLYTAFGPMDWRPTAAARKPVHGPHLRHDEYAATKMDHMNLTTLELHEVSDENRLSGEESEVHEDTEEIDALLYSDDDDDDDEVRSTDHSPIYGLQEQLEPITEEVASSNSPNKRQKLLDAGYRKPSLVDTGSTVKVEDPHRNDNDGESSYAIGQNQEEEMVSILGNKQLRRDKIRATLKILESIIPGAKDKDPLLILDEAIVYLKSLKLKAKTLGENYPLGFSPALPCRLQKWKEE